MIIIDPSETTGSPPSERSPLTKAREVSPTTHLANKSAPPPPYAVSAAPAPAPVLSYFSVPVSAPHQHYVQQPHHPPRPFKRFLKAFIVAVIILFLWGAFLDSVDMVAGKRHGGHRRRHRYNQVVGVVRQCLSTLLSLFLTTFEEVHYTRLVRKW